MDTTPGVPWCFTSDNCGSGKGTGDGGHVDHDASPLRESSECDAIVVAPGVLVRGKDERSSTIQSNTILDSLRRWSASWSF
jgi:hypothetical protein